MGHSRLYVALGMGNIEMGIADASSLEMSDKNTRRSSRDAFRLVDKVDTSL